MSTQLKTRPPENRTIEAPAKPHEPIAHVPETAPIPSRTTAWGAVIVALVVVALSLVAISMISDDTASSAPEYVPAFDSPGGNSMNLPTTGTDAYVPAFESPGGNSMNLPTTGTDAYVPAFDSPGGNSLKTVAAVALVPAIEGPGGHSLNIP